MSAMQPDRHRRRTLGEASCHAAFFAVSSSFLKCEKVILTSIAHYFSLKKLPDDFIIKIGPDASAPERKTGYLARLDDAAQCRGRMAECLFGRCRDPRSLRN